MNCHAVHEDPRSDRELVQAVRDGDTASYDELYRRHQKMANQVARRAGASFHDADDIVSEAHTKVLRALRHGLGPTENFPGYLATAVRRVAWASERASWRMRPTDDALLDGSVEDPDLDPLGDTAVGAALAALSPAMQALLWRVVIEGHGVSDIARELGTSPNSISAAAWRARKRLRAEYGLRVSVA